TLPAGGANLGTDLSDDHPISFRYDSALAARDARLRHPSALPPELPLDHNLEMQCTTCHDAHDNSRGMFLTMHNVDSAMCVSCHQMGQTTLPAHRDCASCHQPHSAPSGPYLLRAATATDTCLRCHDGTHPGALNIAADLSRFFAHDDRRGFSGDTPAAGCTDCHEPHTMGSGSALAPDLHPSMGRIDGVSVSGAALEHASHEYEVCFKCHADRTDIQPRVPRRMSQNNTRLEFSPSAASAHPVVVAGRSSEVPSLLPGWHEGSIIACSDCHATDRAGGSGVHGSNYEPLLKARYETADFISESAQAYALCYSCHDRSSILSNESY